MNFINLMEEQRTIYGLEMHEDDDGLRLNYNRN